MEATLEKRIVNLEQQFLLAVLSNDEEALEKVSQEQSQFSNHIKALKASRALDDKTALLTSYLAGSIENVANCALHVEAIFQDAQYHLNDLIREIPPNTHETLSHSPPTMPYHLLFSHHPSPVQTTLGQNKSLDAYAYRWLMQNLHNPYPTSMQFQVLGDLSGTSVAQVELWFEEMRDAIGWTKLSHEYFASSPSATVAAARRVYLERDKDVPFGVVFAFTAVRASAETHFLKHPALQEKDLNEDCTLSDTLKAQDRYPGPEGVFVPFSVDSLTPVYNPLYLSDDDESEEEEEDTTPPPAVAGCKRRLTEDVLTLGDSDSVKPPKRYRMGSVTEYDLSKQECTPSCLSVSLLERINTQATEPVSVDMSPTRISSDFSSPPTPLHLYDTSTSACRKRGRAEFHEDPSDNFVSLIDVPQRPVQRRKVIEGASPVPSGQVYGSPVGPGNHPPLGPSPPSEQASSPPFPHSIVAPVSVGADVSNPGMIDYDSIPSPQKDVTWISLPASIDVPNSDFLRSNPQLPHVPDLGCHFTAGSSSSYSLGTLPSFGELSCLSSSPTSSSSSASLHSETPSTTHVFDCLSFTGLIDSVSPTQSQSSSQTSFSTPHRIRAEVEGTLSNQECAPPALSNSDPLLECNGTQDTEPTSVDMSPTHTSSDSSLHPISSSHSYATFMCHKQGRAELDEDPSDNFASRNDVPPRPIRRRKVMESASPVPSGQVCSSPVGPGNHPPLGPSPPSEQASSLPFPHSIVAPVFVDADVSNPGIIDCDSIPSPQKDVAWIPMLACITVSNSDFLGSNPQLPHVPSLEYHFTAGSSSSYLLGNSPSFGELGYLSSSPTSSSSAASLYSETPSTSQVFDWSNLTEFIDPVFLTQSQSSSQISLPTPPSTLPNTQEDSLLTPILPSYGFNQLGSLLDPSIPPSALLPIQLDASAEDINLWPLYEVS